jgi:hypothetical protein
LGEDVGQRGAARAAVSYPTGSYPRFGASHRSTSATVIPLRRA